MRLNSVYTKLLASFVMVLLLAIALVAGWFTWMFMDVMDADDAFDVRAQAELGRMLLVEAAEARPDLSPADNPRLKKTLESVAELYDARVWLVDDRGAVIIKTFTGEPETITPGHHFELDGVTVYKDEDSERHLVDLPLTLGRWGPATFHAVFEDRIEPAEIGQKFMRGLILIALVVALMILPISHLITAPVRRLQDAMLRYAGGDLSSRFRSPCCPRRDEIGELGRAFNVMADSLESMIRGARELVANVSHELRSPLARLRVSEELVRERAGKSGAEGCERHLDSIREEVEHLDGLIGRILELSRLDLREPERRLEPVELMQLAGRVAERFGESARRAGVEFFVELGGVQQKVEPGEQAGGASSDAPGGLKPGPQALVMGRREDLDSVLSNLLDNAVKFCTPGGAMHLRLGTRSGRVAVEVTNSYEPLPPEELDAIFRPFHRAGGQRAEGYGLGLALARRIVERHGGEIRAVNVEDGLAVRFELPLSE